MKEARKLKSSTSFNPKIFETQPGVIWYKSCKEIAGSVTFGTVET